MSASWYELRLAESDGQHILRFVYTVADDLGAASVHHFSGEPWCAGPVVRILIGKAGAKNLRRMFVRRGRDMVEWDASGDKASFGDAWPDVVRFFEAASRLALVDTPEAFGGSFHRKLVHCALNAWGYDDLGETRFLLRSLYGRLRLVLHRIWWAAPWTRRRSCRYGCHRPEWRTP